MYAFTAENDLDIPRRDTKKRRQKTHHVVGRPPIARLRRNTHFELGALGLANSDFARARLAQYVDYQRVRVPMKEGLLLRASHASIIRLCHTAFFSSP